MTGNLPTVPLWGEGKSSGKGNSDLKSNFHVALCAGALWHKVAEGITNATQKDCKKTGHTVVELKRWPAAQD